jgi:hypothetical protein
MAQYLELTREVMNAIRRRREADEALGSRPEERKTPASPPTMEFRNDREWEEESES